jgi:coproporphyrinogen III oxidase
MAKVDIAQVKKYLLQLQDQICNELAQEDERHSKRTHGQEVPMAAGAASGISNKKRPIRGERDGPKKRCVSAGGGFSLAYRALKKPATNDDSVYRRS